MQPGRIEACRHIIILVKQGALHLVDTPFPESDAQLPAINPYYHTWYALIAYARKQKGMVIDFLPKKTLTNEPIELPEGDDAHILNSRQLLETMKTLRLLPSEDYESARQALGTEGYATPLGNQPEEGTPLFCDRAIIILLANAGILDCLCHHYSVFITDADHKAIISEIASSEHEDQLGRWLDMLMDRIRRGRQTGIYQVMPAFQEEDPDDDDDVNETHEMRCLLALAQPTKQSCDVAWIDDRFISRYPRLDGGVPIVGIYDVLQSLVRQGILTREAYYRKYIDLLASNLRFLPVLKDDIRYFLREVLIRDGLVVPTRELNIIRHYLMACAQQTEFLDISTPEDESITGVGELPYLLAMGEEIENALYSVWDDDTLDDITGVAYANWLMETLEAIGIDRYWGMVSASDTTMQTSLLGAQLARLLVHATMLPSAPSHGTVCRGTYLAWLWEWILQRHIPSSPTLIPRIAESLAGCLSTQVVKGDLNLQDYNQFIDELPLQLKEVLQTDDTCARCDIH